AALVADAVVPVIEEVIGEKREEPHPPVVRRQRQKREMVVDDDIDPDPQRQREHTGNLAQDPGRQRSDRIVEPIDVAPERQSDAILGRHEREKDRNCVYDDVQPTPPKRVRARLHLTEPPPPPAGQMRPSKTKPDQIKPSKIAWICLVLFVRTGTFQWVAAEKIRKIPLSLLTARRLATRGFDPPRGQRFSTDSDFRKEIARVRYEAPSPSPARSPGGP